VRSDASSPVQARGVARSVSVGQPGDWLSDTDGGSRRKRIGDRLIGRDQLPTVGQADDGSVADDAGEPHDAVARGQDELPPVARQIDAAMTGTPAVWPRRVTGEQSRWVQGPVEPFGGWWRWWCSAGIGPGGQDRKQCQRHTSQ
jgi:hypothetical protein